VNYFRMDSHPRFAGFITTAMCTSVRSATRISRCFFRTEMIIRSLRRCGARRGRRPNARCPVCGSLDRDRLLYLYLLHKTSTFLKPVKLLHVAPERPLERIFRGNAG